MSPPHRIQKPEALRVLHVTLDMGFGGAEKVIQHLATGLDARDIHTEVACLDEKVGPLGEALQQAGITVHKLDRKKGGLDRLLIGRLRTLIRQGNFDVVHCHQYTPYVYGVLGAALLNSKVIFTEHGRFYPDKGTWKRKLINPVLALFTAQIVAISKATKTALIEYENLPSSKITVIYNGIPDPADDQAPSDTLREQLGIPEDCLVLGTISRLDSIKNQSLMIEALAIVQEKCNARLLLVGDGPERDNLEHLVEERGLAGLVIFAGYQLNPMPYHRIMDIFLLTSFSEGASMTLLESMALAVPAVVTNVGGNPEVVSNKETGVVLDAVDNAAELADAICTLHDDIDQRNELGKAARQRFDALFAVDEMINAYVDVYAP